MATFRTTQSTRVNNVESGTYRPNPANQDIGPLRCSFFTYATSGTEAVGDKIELCEVPAGARILSVYVVSPDLGTEATIAIGDSGSNVRLVEAVDCAGASGFQDFTTLEIDVNNTVDNPTAGFGYKYSEQTTILAEFTAATGISANKQLRGFIAYMVN